MLKIIYAEQKAIPEETGDAEDGKSSRRKRERRTRRNICQGSTLHLIKRLKAGFLKY